MSSLKLTENQTFTQIMMLNKLREAHEKILIIAHYEESLREAAEVSFNALVEASKLAGIELKSDVLKYTPRGGNGAQVKKRGSQGIVINQENL